MIRTSRFSGKARNGETLLSGESVDDSAMMGLEGSERGLLKMHL